MSPRRLSLRPAATIEAAPVVWAWADRVPVGGVTLLVGDPGFGKSTLTVELVARASRGQLEGDLHGVPVPVALVGAEDAVAQVVRPRLEAAGADLERTLIVEATDENVPTGLELPGDLSALETRLRETGVRWLVIDPVVAHLPAGIDSNKDQHVRRALAPLAKLAETLDMAVVCIVHLNKSADVRAVGRVCGSVGFVGAARSVLVLGPDPEQPDSPSRVLLHWKSNHGALAPALRFLIAGRVLQTPDAEVKTSCVAWCGEAAGVTAKDMLSPEPDDDASALDEAAAFLTQLLKAKPLPTRDVLKAAREADVAEKTLRRAKKRLGVKVTKAGQGPWTWSLPEGGQAGRHSQPWPSSAESPSPGDHNPQRREENVEGGQDGQDSKVEDVGHLREACGRCGQPATAWSAHDAWCGECWAPRASADASYLTSH